MELLFMVEFGIRSIKKYINNEFDIEFNFI